MTTPAWHDDYSSEEWLRETAADVKAEFYAQASPEEAEEQARSDGWRP